MKLSGAQYGARCIVFFSFFFAFVSVSINFPGENRRRPSRITRRRSLEDPTSEIRACPISRKKKGRGQKQQRENWQERAREEAQGEGREERMLDGLHEASRGFHEDNGGTEDRR